MIDTIRNMFRRKLRTGLTVLGILIGVFALTVMGAMAEKMNLLIGGGVQYYGGHVTVQPNSQAGFGGSPLSVGVVRRLDQVRGVAASIPSVYVLLKSGQSSGFGPPNMAVGAGPRMTQYEPFKLYAAQGRLLEANEHGVAFVGSSIAKEYKIRVGQIFAIHGMPFHVVGIGQTTMTAPDTSVGISLTDAQKMYWSQLPPMLRRGVSPGQLASEINVYPKPGVNGNLLAARIKSAGIPGIKVLSPRDMQKQLDQIGVVFNLIIMGSAVIALIVGSLSVINTMAMSVAERVKEIGLKKAIGAHTSHILREYLAEAAVIGFLGGIAGLALGSLVVYLINSSTTTTQIFAVTERLAIGSVVFATILGMGAGLFPALRAARLNPVDALRSE